MLNSLIRNAFSFQVHEVFSWFVCFTVLNSFTRHNTKHHFDHSPFTCRPDYCFFLTFIITILLIHPSPRLLLLPPVIITFIIITILAHLHLSRRLSRGCWRCAGRGPARRSISPSPRSATSACSRAISFLRSPCCWSWRRR